MIKITKMIKISEINKTQITWSCTELYEITKNCMVKEFNDIDN